MPMAALAPLRAHFATLVALAVLTAIPATTRAQVIDDRMPGTDGTVLALARSGNTLYLAGQFSAVGRCTGGGVPVDARTGVPARRFPRITGTVNAVEPDGRGGWFVGGAFYWVEGEAHPAIAHVLADGRVAHWNASMPGGRVSTLVLVGRTLYVGGVFTNVNGATRNNIAALDAGTGTLLPWNPGANGSVRFLCRGGERLYAGGGFTMFGDSIRGHLAAIELRDGRIGRWNPAADGDVFGIAPQGRTIYVAGEFDHVGSADRNSVAAVDAETGVVTGWDAALTPRRTHIAHGDWIWPFAEGLAVHGNTVYVGGKFDASHGVARNGIAALDAKTGQPTAFDARIGGSHVNAVTFLGERLLVGGCFWTIRGTARSHLAELDPHTGDVMPWNPSPIGPTGESYGRLRFRWLKLEGVVGRIAVGGDRVFVAGGFSQIHDWIPRASFAAIDLRTGAVLPWAPTTDGYSTTGFGVIGNTVYISGDFEQVDGVARHHIGAVDATVGALRPWYPDLRPAESEHLATSVNTLVTHDHTVYLSGYIFGIGDVDVNNVAAVDAETALPMTWNPHAEAGAYAILPTEHAIYVGGDVLHHLGGEARVGLGAVDPILGNALPWNPVVQYYRYTGIHALSEGAGTIYMGGYLTAVNGTLRSNAAAVDSVIGAPKAWAPEPDDLVWSIATQGDRVWMGGRFQQIGGRTRPYLAIVDTATGAASEWDARAGAEVMALHADDDLVLAGGAFTELQGLPRGGVGVIHVAPPHRHRHDTLATTASSGSAGGLVWSVPSPMRGTGSLSLTLPAAAAVRVAVYDIQGREVGLPAGGSVRPAGTHVIPLDASTWAPGVYLCRIHVGDQAATKKVVVVH